MLYRVSSRGAPVLRTLASHLPRRSSQWRCPGQAAEPRCRRACAGLSGPGQSSASEPPYPAAPQLGDSSFFHRWLRSSRDGMPIYCGVWGSGDKPPRAVVVYAHCFGSHVHDPRGFQENLLKPLAGQGYAVWGYDSRGQGRSGKAADRFGDIGDGEERMDDLATVIRTAGEHFAGAPVFLLGHSMGASEELAFMSLRQGSPEGRAIRGLVLLAPACNFKDRFPVFLRFLLKLESWRGSTHFDVHDLWRTSEISKDFTDTRMGPADLQHLFKTCDADGSGLLDLGEFSEALNNEMGLGLSEEEIRTSFDQLDSDSDGKVSIEELVQHLSSDHPEHDYRLSHFKLSSDFLWYDRVMDPAKITAPLLFVHGKKDRVNKYEAARSFVEATGSPDKTVRAFENLRNGVAMDMDAPHVLREVLAWLDERTSS